MIRVLIVLGLLLFGCTIGAVMHERDIISACQTYGAPGYALWSTNVRMVCAVEQATSGRGRKKGGAE